MSAPRISIVGGGPAGLFAARLLALDHSDWDIRLYERLPPARTFGFGVGLTGGLLAALREADPDTHDDIVAAAFSFAGAEFRLPSGRATLGRWHAGAIGRARLLEILNRRAIAAGVSIRRAEVTVEEVRASSDLVIAADGVSSATREALAEDLAAESHFARGVFIWCAGRTPLTGTVFEPVLTPHGLFVVHAYPYDDGLATLVIETDSGTLERAGCRQAEFADHGASDEIALRYLGATFTDLLQGGQLIGNRSRWMHFRTVRCGRWHTGNVVLLGDARATVHPSLGSGTKVAMEDAIALRDALSAAGGDLVAALPEYERTRRPAVERLQRRAHRSLLWWESLPSRLHLSAARAAVAYLSRAGAVSLEALVESSPELSRRAVADWAGVDESAVPADGLNDWIIGRALLPQAQEGRRPSPGVRLEIDCDDPWSPEGDDLVARAAQGANAVGAVIELGGGDARSAVLDRLAFGERIRTELGLPVATRVPADHVADAADGLVAGRTDYVVVGS